jgi:K+-sensing histidine kinase KdpD
MNAMNTQPSYDKILDPIDDISTSIEALLEGSFGRLMGDQRESLKRIYNSGWGLHTLFLDVITSIGIENIAQRQSLEEQFHVHVAPIRENASSLLAGEDGPLNEEQEICVEYIHEIGIVLQSYVDKLWLYSRMENNLLKVQKRAFLLKDFLLEHQWLQGKSEFRLEMAIPEEPLYLNADASLLATSLRMLFENAFQASEGGLIRLSIEVSKKALSIRLEDEGRGIPLQYCKEIFEPFFQVNKINTGLGLGLSLARGILNLHDGSLDLDESYNKGTAFIMGLPLEL